LRIVWTDDLKDCTGLETYERIKRTAEDRRCKSITVDLLRQKMADDYDTHEIGKKDKKTKQRENAYKLYLLMMMMNSKF